MPKYRVLEMSFINDRIVQAGEEIEYAGDPDANLEPLDDEGKAIQEHYVNVKEPARRKAMAEQIGSAGIADPEAFARELAKANAEMIGKQVAEGIAAAFALMFPNGLNKPPASPVTPPAADAPLV